MTRFWTGVGAVSVVALLAVFAAAGGSNLEVNDLETECRGDRGVYTVIELHPDNSMSFKGYFPVENPEADLRYSYSRSADSIVLDVRSEGAVAPESFWNTCLASAVYDFDTSRLEEGRYSVEVRHNGERVEKRVITVR
ncbi:MAG: hypothetical protein ABEJ95_01975 [Candidatus Nanohalobium sp.]